MTGPDDRYRDQTAQFRFSVIADLVHPQPGDDRSVAERIRHKAAAEYRIPGSGRNRVAAQTIYGWLRRYRLGGYEALRPKRRRDAGRPRRMSVEMIETLLAYKREHPTHTVRDSIAAVRGRLGLAADVPMPPSTVHRLFHNEGLMLPQQPAPQDRRRFSFEHAGDLWMSDVMHGPAVPVDGARRRRTYLICFLDDATRVIPYASFELSENTSAFFAVFKQAIMRRGVPRRLYVDNGAAYRSENLAIVCAKLGIALIHARPYQPAGKGKQERFFRTVRGRLMAHLDESDLASPGALNRRLHAWVEGEYHHTPHRGLDNITPLDRWAGCAQNVRLCEPHVDLDDLFLYEAARKVMNDRTIRLNNRIYEVEPQLIGQTVTVRYDPQAPAARPVSIVHDGDTTSARPVDVHANATARRQVAPSPLNFQRFNDSNGGR